VKPNDRTWLSYIVAFALPLVALGLAVARQWREHRRAK
jgi:hypothetical protein